MGAEVASHAFENPRRSSASEGALDAPSTWEVRAAGVHGFAVLRRARGSIVATSMWLSYLPGMKKLLGFNVPNSNSILDLIYMQDEEDRREEDVDFNVLDLVDPVVHW